MVVDGTANAILCREAVVPLPGRVSEARVSCHFSSKSSTWWRSPNQVWQAASTQVFRNPPCDPCSRESSLATGTVCSVEASVFCYEVERGLSTRLSYDSKAMLSLR